MSEVHLISAISPGPCWPLQGQQTEGEQKGQCTQDTDASWKKGARLSLEGNFSLQMSAKKVCWLR
jgi:hypothetical protein